ncbi:hypothetical protein IV203_027195 [Nitzschia inconspicua]|uniref:Uncharacterized protein n=1 Tax=Nitzschia inconspicua TaxID=303405 RepID=A0A9K3Q5S2_9STRA|nr:hypothetical protein IV203_027195 [Nitzschia inconspicua]
MPASNNHNSDPQRRLCEPFRLLVTPYRDLMILERTTNCNHPNNKNNGNNNNKNNEIENDHPYVLWRLHKVNEIPALPSLGISRQAHGWTAVNSTQQQPDDSFIRLAWLEWQWIHRVINCW